MGGEGAWSQLGKVEGDSLLTEEGAQKPFESWEGTRFRNGGGGGIQQETIQHGEGEFAK